MADISKCYGKECDLKESCYRYTAPSSYFQAYADFDDKYFDSKQLNSKVICKHYWKNNPREILKKI